MLEFNNVIIENCVVIVEKLENCGYWVDGLLEIRIFYLLERWVFLL